jgi:hypothetical protein
LHRDKHCTLIVLYPQQSHTVYFDSGSETRKDYSNIKYVLDGALTGYYFKGGVIKKEIRRSGKLIFGHKTEFPCVKQPPNSTRDAYYAIHHMREFVRDQEQLMLPSNVQNWAQDLANSTDADLRLEFYRI